MFLHSCTSEICKLFFLNRDVKSLIKELDKSILTFLEFCDFRQSYYTTKSK